jgi:HK97 family phage portal protein
LRYLNHLITQIDAGMGYTGDVQGSTLRNPEEWMFEAFGGGARADSGERVNAATALSHGPVWQAVNILAGDVGQLPLNVYKRPITGDKRAVDIAADHPVNWLLSKEPNPFQTPAIWKETMMAWALLWGNGCSYIARDGNGRPKFLIPLLPDRTWPVWVDAINEETGEPEEGGEWFIETDFGDGKREPLFYSDVFHLRGLATDGFWGLSAIQVAKNVIGGGMSMMKQRNRTFKNGLTPGGALTSESKEPPPEVRAEYRRQIDSIHAGAENAGKWLMLWGGTKFSPFSMSNVDAQALQMIDLDREQVASLFMLPPYKLGAMKNSAVRANLEQQNSDYLYTSLSRHLNKAKEEAERKLFSDGERRLQRVFIEWDVDVILKADLAARGTYYSQAIAGEWMTKNEVRYEEGLPPLAGGDVTRNPAINPAQPKPTEPPKREPPPVAPEEATDAARALIRSQVDTMLSVEANRIERMSKSSQPFLQWADEFYDNYAGHAEPYLRISCKLATSLGLEANWRPAVEMHARDSRQALNAIAGLVSKTDLPDAVRDHVDRVRALGDIVTTTILGAMK